jgi:hypothetical protein
MPKPACTDQDGDPALRLAAVWRNLLSGSALQGLGMDARDKTLVLALTLVLARTQLGRRRAAPSDGVSTEGLVDVVSTHTA